MPIGDEHKGPVSTFRRPAFKTQKSLTEILQGVLVPPVRYLRIQVLEPVYLRAKHFLDIGPLMGTYVSGIACAFALYEYQNGLAFAIQVRQRVLVSWIYDPHAGRPL